MANECLRMAGADAPMGAGETPAGGAAKPLRGPKKHDVVGLLRGLERHGEDNIWRTAKDAREEIECLRSEAARLEAFEDWLSDRAGPLLHIDDVREALTTAKPNAQHKLQP